MIIIDLDRGAPVSSPAAPLSIALGSFDGVHIGHRELIRRAASAVSGRENAVCAVWTFNRNPFGIPYLTELDEKLELFRISGARYAVVCTFEEVSRLSPEEFVDLLHASGVIRCVCGYNYTFGKEKAGNAERLKSLCAEKGMDCETVDRIELNGEEVSSTRIRRLLAEGDVLTANSLLGRRYSITYPVTHGNEIGRTLGFPTANQIIPEGRAPLRRGVYITGAKGFPSITNIGVRPTVCNDGGIVCETHIIGFDGDLYGEKLTVEFRSFLREEQKFASLDDLKLRLESDAAAACRKG